MRIAAAFATLCSLTLSMTSLLPSGTAGATTISASTRLSALPSEPGSGLSAAYYILGGYSPNLESAARAAAGLRAPAATFTASTICFPTCGATAKDGNTLAAYITANGHDLAGNPVLGPSYSIFSGALAIPKAGTYSFSLYSDDGSSLTIGDTVVASMTGTQPWAGVTRSATFTEAGLYPITVQEFDIGGYTGVTVLENGGPLTANSLYGPVLLAHGLSSVPEPASLTLLAVGLGAVAAYRRTTAMSAA